MTRLLIVSPHLDDAVLSCGRLLAAHPSSVVLTVFAGRPADRAPVTKWDLSCGFTAGEDVIAVRRAEDADALHRLGATPRWMDERQDEYRDGKPSHARIRDAIAAAVCETDVDTVISPLGMEHADHVAVASACLDAQSSLQTRQWVLYADQPYAARGLTLSRRLDQLHAGGFGLTPTRLPVRGRLCKARALWCYRSQWRGLGRGVMLSAVWRPEQYWRPAPLAAKRE